MKEHQISFQFISEPLDVNFGGKVHGGMVMKWIDQTAFACASNWAEAYCVTIYVGGIKFYKPIQISEIVKIDASIIYTGRTSMHIAVDVASRPVVGSKFEKTTHCIIVFVCVDAVGNPQAVQKWIPTTKAQKDLEGYAIRLMDLRKTIEVEMEPYLKG
jgi:acyl-CoA hydrolase